MKINAQNVLIHIILTMDNAIKINANKAPMLLNLEIINDFVNKIAKIVYI